MSSTEQSHRNVNISSTVCLFLYIKENILWAKLYVYMYVYMKRSKVREGSSSVVFKRYNQKQNVQYICTHKYTVYYITELKILSYTNLVIYLQKFVNNDLTCQSGG